MNNGINFDVELDYKNGWKNYENFILLEKISQNIIKDGTTKAIKSLENMLIGKKF